MDNSNKFENDIKVLLDNDSDNLDADISRRLQQARYAALEKVKPRTIWNFYPQALTATFAVAVISAGLIFSFNENEIGNMELAMESELEMLTANESLDLMDELEFMQWLVESEEYAS